MNTIPEILVIENDSMTSEILSILLSKENYKVTLVSDGNDAIALAQKKTFDLVITAILIPPRTGLEVIHFMNQNYPEIPVIAISSIAAVEKTIEEAFTLGASDLINKPFNPNELLLRVKRLLKK